MCLRCFLFYATKIPQNCFYFKQKKNFSVSLRIKKFIQSIARLLLSRNI
ncbi:hypothetical protein HMPREF1345_00588 [Enterococcus faecium TX1337RF]|nr:hypothetical protein HMPREF1345_00588 [Enterococcus faecium TX1337RF]